MAIEMWPNCCWPSSLVNFIVLATALFTFSFATVSAMYSVKHGTGTFAGTSLGVNTNKSDQPPMHQLQFTQSQRYNRALSLTSNQQSKRRVSAIPSSSDSLNAAIDVFGEETLEAQVRAKFQTILLKSNGKHWKRKERKGKSDENNLDLVIAALLGLDDQQRRDQFIEKAADLVFALREADRIRSFDFKDAQTGQAGNADLHRLAELCQLLAIEGPRVNLRLVREAYRQMAGKVLHTDSYEALFKASPMGPEWREQLTEAAKAVNAANKELLDNEHRLGQLLLLTSPDNLQQARLRLDSTTLDQLMNGLNGRQRGRRDPSLVKRRHNSDWQGF